MSSTQPPGPALIVFDKDGTLIDFHFMWARWLAELARRLESASGIALAAPLYSAMGLDAEDSRVSAEKPLAVNTMKQLRDLTIAVVEGAGVTRTTAERLVAETWFAPDPLLWARPLADLPCLFSALQREGLRIAVATSDDRAPTLASLQALGVGALTNALACADDGLPNKPAPDMLLALCRQLDVPPAQTIMVGDAVADMEMARNAGVGLKVGVTSGLARAAELAAYADLVLDSIQSLLAPDAAAGDGQTAPTGGSSVAPGILHLFRDFAAN